MKAEETYTEQEEIDGWKVHIVTYKIGDRYYCTIDNVDPGARFARAEGATRDEVEREALEKARKYLGQTREVPDRHPNAQPAELVQRRRALGDFRNQRERADDVTKFVQRQFVFLRGERLHARHVTP